MFIYYLITFLFSMIPIFELRGAIPYAVFGHGIHPAAAYAISVVGNFLPAPFIFLFLRKILLWGKDKKFIGKFFSFCLNKGEKGGQKLQKNGGKGLFLALILFVGIPLPVTGAWTGTLAASILDMDFKKAMLAVFCGILLAGVIVTLVVLGPLSFLANLFIKNV